MPIEAELVYRAQDTAGRKDAAYVILMRRDEHNAGSVYQVNFYWGAWDRYITGSLQRKNAYTGNSYGIAKNNVVEAMNKREQRGYELQAHLSRFPAWLPAPLTAPQQPAWQSPPEVRVIEQPPDPEPLPAGRVKHTRARFLEL